MADDTQSQDGGWATARTLAEALPYIQRYDRETVVIKYGGHAMGEEQVAKLFAADAVLLKMLGVYPVVVHGGGPQISAWLSKAGVKSTFVDGLRVTDEATMEVAEMVLSGAINKEIASWITQAGAEADVRGVGLSGKDARLITVEKVTRTKKDPGSRIEQEIDLGFVGEPTKVSLCHCLACQKRTGSIFGTQARFARELVTIEGKSTQWMRRGDSGGAATFHFCPVCAAKVYWEIVGVPDFVSVAVGAFADPNFPPPRVSVYEERQHKWALAAGQLPLEHQF